MVGGSRLFFTMVKESWLRTKSKVKRVRQISSSWFSILLEPIATKFWLEGHFKNSFQLSASAYVSKPEHASICNWKLLERTVHCMTNSKNLDLPKTPHSSTAVPQPSNQAFSPPLSKDGIGRFVSGKNEAQPKIGTFRVGQCLNRGLDRVSEDSGVWLVKIHESIQGHLDSWP